MWVPCAYVFVRNEIASKDGTCLEFVETSELVGFAFPYEHEKGSFNVVWRVFEYLECASRAKSFDFSNGCFDPSVFQL